MAHEVFDPEHLKGMVPGFHSAVKSGGLIFMAGQVAFDEKLEVVSGGLEAQTRQTLLNLKEVLELAGGRPEDLVQFMIFYKEVEGLSVSEAVGALVPLKNEILPGSAPVGFACSVKELLLPGLLIEIQAIAATSKES
jgi:enamine deaminase RidA (YjgF/YER057c/UK114 family)